MHSAHPPQRRSPKLGAVRACSHSAHLVRGLELSVGRLQRAASRRGLERRLQTTERRPTRRVACREPWEVLLSRAWRHAQRGRAVGQAALEAGGDPLAAQRHEERGHLLLHAQRNAALEAIQLLHLLDQAPERGGIAREQLGEELPRERRLLRECGLLRRGLAELLHLGLGYHNTRRRRQRRHLNGEFTNRQLHEAHHGVNVPAADLVELVAELLVADCTGVVRVQHPEHNRQISLREIHGYQHPPELLVAVPRLQELLHRNVL
mmetsp:Transcript_27683/g.82520  ORF Transcript_27683/g.82520 Transcript_27683/m.82520 type:complete len:264 (+) Transcript_27683:159-950(+)